jgi:hypothetical protein
VSHASPGGGNDRSAYVHLFGTATELRFQSGEQFSSYSISFIWISLAQIKQEGTQNYCKRLHFPVAFIRSLV